MKKIFIAFCLIAGFSVISVAQPRAIGGRLGYGVEFSYQHTLGKNMLSLDVGVPGFYGLEAAITYDWIFPINSWQEKGTWNWYAGVGAGGGWSWYNYAHVGVAGRIGVEYNFWFPMQLSLDFRPIIGPGFYDGGVAFNASGFYAGGIALGIRYNF